MTNGNKMLGVFTALFLVVFLVAVIGSTAFAGGTDQPEQSVVETPRVEQPSPLSYEYSVSVAYAELDSFFVEAKRIESERIAEAERAEKAAVAEEVKPSVSVPQRVYISDNGMGRWDQLAQCETGGNWATNTGNGYGGGLQFAHQRSWSTWLASGGGEFAPNPWDASREQQIVVAERVLASSGWGAWPGCSRKFGWL